MWNFVASLIGGPIVNGLIDAYKARLAAGNDSDRMAADLAAKELELERRSRELNAQIIVTEQGRWWTAAPRSLVQWSCAGFIVKCIVYDNMLGLGTTDPLGGQVGEAFTAVIVMWFGGRTLEKVAQIFKR